MFIKNLTDKTLIFNAKGSSIALTANATTLIPDGLTTLQELQTLFGERSVMIDTTGPSTSIMTNQQVCNTGKLYMTYPEIGAKVRLFVGVSGSVDVMGSDSQTPPASYSAMSCPTGNTGVSGMSAFAIIPRYIAFKVNSGSPEIIVTGMKLIEVGSIS